MIAMSLWIMAEIDSAKTASNSFLSFVAKLQAIRKHEASLNDS